MGERGRERERVRESQRGVPGTKPCGSASKGAVDIDYLSTNRCEEFVDLGVSAVLQRPQDHLGVNGCRDQNGIASSEVRSEQLNRSLVLRFRRVEKRDDDVGVERYSPHSLRN